jgi:hypothetical protein
MIASRIGGYSSFIVLQKFPDYLIIDLTIAKRGRGHLHDVPAAGPEGQDRFV